MSIKIDKCLEKVGNRFMLATVISRRWEQLATGGRPLVSTRDPRSMTTVFREIEENKTVLNREAMMIERHGEPVEPPAPLEGTEELFDLPDDIDDEEEEEELEADAADSADVDADVEADAEAEEKAVPAGTEASAEAEEE
jgi:DNA-directed RNA polymerase omega subunit